MLHAVIIDDEPAGVETLKMLAERLSHLIRIVGTALQAEAGIRLIEDYRPDVVFLDISMPGMNGFELLQQLSYRQFNLVFTTAHREFAIAAIKEHAFDYLLKPIDEADFRNCLLDLQTNTRNTFGHASPPAEPATPALLEVPAKDGILFLKQHQLIRLEAARSYTFLFMEGGQKHTASRSLGEFETRLNNRLFYRCHHSHIVNLQKVQKFINHNGFYALLSDGSQVEVAKKHRDAFLEKIKHIS